MRRRFQFGLRGLLALMAALALVSVPAGYIYRYRQSLPVPVPVTGTVTVNGKPAAGWRVTFHYKSFDWDKLGSNAAAVTDKAGHFTMVTSKAVPPGVWPGNYAVAIAPPALPPGARFTGTGFLLHRHNFPTRYTNPDSSGLAATVRGSGANDFRFDLTGSLNDAPGEPPENIGRYIDVAKHRRDGRINQLLATFQKDGQQKTHDIALQEEFGRLAAGELPEPNLPMLFQLGDIGRLPDEHIRVLHIAGPNEALVDVRSYESVDLAAAWRVDEGRARVGVVGANFEMAVLRGVDTSMWVAGKDYELKGEFEVTGTTTYGAVVGKDATLIVLEPFDRKRLEPWLPVQGAKAGDAPREPVGAR